MQRRLLWTLFACLLLLTIGLNGPLGIPAAFSAAAGTRTPTSVPLAKPANTGAAWLKVYFTNPDPPDNVANGIDTYVVPVLNKAKKSIDITSFDFTLPSVANALIAAAKRGVAVRIVIDGKNGTQTLDAAVSPTNKDIDVAQQLKDARIPIVDGGRSNGLMHNKMIIVDGATLFMGSWNMSYNDTFRNNNNLLKITSQKLIANYQAKFNELFVDKKFGAKAIVGALTPNLTLDGIQVENYFSPVDNVMDKLVAYIKGAKKSIKFAAFTYTAKDLSAAMIDRAKAGVKVTGVIENRGASQGAFVPLFCAGLPVVVDGNKYTMHHKVIVIDNSFVITGSFNFTASADEANDDNVLVIHSPTVAALYSQEIDRVYALGAKPVTPPDCK